MTVGKSDFFNQLYYFVDEAGDPTFYNKYGNNIVGLANGSSKILLLGFIRTDKPFLLRKSNRPCIMKSAMTRI